MNITLATLKQIQNDPAWVGAFAHLRKDRRYFEIVEETLNQGFEHHYLVLENDAGERAIQPLFVHDQDLLAGSGPRLQNIAKRLRRLIPRFARLRTLMIGCAAGEGRLAAPWVAPMLADHLKSQAKKLKCSLVVMKEFHCEGRQALKVLVDRGFTRVPSLPMTRLNIDYPNFEQYMTSALSKSTRKDLRRKFKALTDAPPLTMEVTADVSHCVDEIYPLYEAVYEKSSLHFEKLNKEFLRRLGKDMADKVTFFIWRQNGKAVALSICMAQDQTLFDEYVGLDYSVALDLHLYFVTLRDIIAWGMEHGFKWYCSTALCYEPKLHLKCELEPLDLYVLHAWPLFNWGMSKALPWLEPTRNEPALKKYPNYHVLWGD